ncbi:DUF6443 domain-containing protein [Emticicia agri]|uniref:DUF6443 domain-containing protein n=1 Tax=Emticicia agri TaxID=2492393 RepID=UPI0013EC86B1|nr:DUF6443 domain-containing protein [Emticicia agri]
MLIPNSIKISSNPIKSKQSFSVASNSATYENNLITTTNSIDSASKNNPADDARIGKGINSIRPLPIKPLPIKIREKLLNLKLIENADENPLNEQEYYRYDSVKHTFNKIDYIEKKIEFDPVRFRVSTNKDSVEIGEEFEIKITAEFLDVSPTLMFQFEGSNEYTLKVLFSNGFVQTGGTYYDFMEGKVTGENPKQEYTIKGYYKDYTNTDFRLLRSHKGAFINDLFIVRLNVTSIIQLKKKSESVEISAINQTTNNSETQIVICNPDIYACKYVEINFVTEIRFSINVSNWKVCKFPLENLTSVNEVPSIEIIEITDNSIRIKYKEPGKYTWQVESCPGSKTTIELNAKNNELPIISGIPSAPIKQNTSLNLSSNCSAVWRKGENIVGSGFTFKPTLNETTIYKVNCDYCGAPSKTFKVEVEECPTLPLNPSISASKDIIQRGETATLTANCPSGDVVWEQQGKTTTVNFKTDENTIIGTYSFKAKCVLGNCESGYTSKDIQVTGTVPPSCTKPNKPIISPANPPSVQSGQTTPLSTNCNIGTPKWSTNATTNTIQGSPGQTYKVWCISGTCISDTSTAVTVSSCSLAAPTINTPSSGIYLSNGQKINISTTYTCPGSFEWYNASNNNYLGAGITSGNPAVNTLSDVGVGSYRVLCRENSTCTSAYSDILTLYSSNAGCTNPKPVINTPVANGSNYVLSTNSTCFATSSNGTVTPGFLRWYKDNSNQSFDNGSTITVNSDGTYEVQCYVDNNCYTELSDPVIIGGCAISTPPTINEGNSTTIPGDQLPTLSTSSSCSYQNGQGSFEWYRDGSYYKSGSAIGAEQGCYQVRCMVEINNSYFYSCFSNKVCISPPGECGNDVYAWSNATATDCGVSLGETLILHGGVSSGTPATEIGWYFGNDENNRITTIGEFTFPNGAQEANKGKYTLKVKRDNIWCKKSIDVEICDCNLVATPKYNFTGTAQNGTITIYADLNKPCPTCEFLWTLPNNGGTRKDTGPFSIQNGSGTSGIYHLAVSNSQCTHYSDLDVHVPVTPSYNGNIVNTSCENIKGFIYDSANKDFQLPNATLVIKKETTPGVFTNLPDVPLQITSYNTFDWTWPYKDGILYKVQVKLPPGGSNGDTFLDPFRITPASIQCCALKFDQDEVKCNDVTKKGIYRVYFKDHSQNKILQYRLSKSNFNASNSSAYTPTGDWVNWIPDIPPNTPSNDPVAGIIQFTNLERGFYRCEIVEGTDTNQKGCTITTYFESDCEIPPICGSAPYINVIPDGVIMEGSGITPTLFAGPTSTSSNNPSGLGRAAELNGNNAIVLNQGLSINSNNFGFEAWVFVKKNNPITVGFIGSGEKHRFLFNIWAQPDNSFFAQLSIGSNGMTLIESIPEKNDRRVSISYDRPLAGWNHLAIFYRNRIPELYLNGVFIGKATQSIFTPYLPSNYTNPSNISATAGRIANSGFVGLIDEIRVWENVIGVTPAAIASALSSTYMSARNNPALYTGDCHDYWSFEDAAHPLYTVDGTPYHLLNFEEAVRVDLISRLLTSEEDKLPQNPNYTWLLNGAVVGTGNSYTMPLDAVKANGQKYVLRYEGNGQTCETSKTIKIERCIDISPTTTQTVCEGATLMLTASSKIATQIVWYKEGRTTAITTGITTNTSNGVFYSSLSVPSSIEGDGAYYAKANNGCSTGKNETERVTVKHNPVSKLVVTANPNPAKAGATVEFTGKVIGDNPTPPTFNWTGPNSFTSTKQDPILTNVTKAAREGTYKLTISELTNNLTCTATATVKLLISNCNLDAGAEASCVNNLGKITVNVLGNTAGRTVEYSINNTTWQSSNEFISLLNGIYKVYVRSRVTGVPIDQGSADICYANVQEVSVVCASICNVQKKLNYDRWDDIEGTEIDNFDDTYLTNLFNKGKSLSAFAPSVESAEKMFEIHNTATQNFIARMKGSICPPVSGDYIFHVYADNSAKVYLNTGSGLQRIVWVQDQPNAHDTPVPSASIHLDAGTSYQFEVHHKQGISASFIKIEWQLNGGTKQLISAEYLDPSSPTLDPPCPRFELATTPAINLSSDPSTIPYKITEGTAIKGIATALDGNTNTFEWKDQQTQGALFTDPKGTSGLSTRTTASTVPIYIRPTKIGTSPYEDKVYRVYYSNKATCYKEIKVRVSAASCDCEGGDCDKISVQNPSLVNEFNDEKNYVVETTYLDESASTGVQSVTYTDGLGRPAQKIAIHAGPEQQDIVQAIEYDSYGRTTTGYLPYPVINNNGKFIATAISNTITWYQSNKSSSTPFSVTDLETSPLSRPTSQKGAGHDNAALNTITDLTYANNTNEVLMFKVEKVTQTINNVTSVSVKVKKDTNPYQANTLYKTISTESGGGIGESLITNEYKDRDGRVVCKDVGGQKTYYIYNDLGQLVSVIPPESSKGTIPGEFTLFGTDSFLEGIFQYEFNGRGLMARKKVPGAVAVTMTYYDNDLLKTTTDYRNDQPVTLIMSYDGINRMLETKEKKGTIDASVPEKTTKKIFYDSYDAIDAAYRLDEDNTRRPDNTEWKVDRNHVIGVMVGFWEATYDTDGNVADQSLPTTIYYDNKQRVIHTVKKNHKQGTDYFSSALDFSGRALATYQSVDNIGLLVTKTKTGYDYGGRPTAVCQKIDNGNYSENWEPIAHYNYNEIGEMVQKILGCRTQVVDYAYNIRGWLTKINDPANLKVTATKEYDFFGMSLTYTGDGNINGQTYKTAITTAQYNTNGLFTDPYDIYPSELFTYDYKYDKFKRLTRAALKRTENMVLLLGESTSNTNDGITYDDNGNIKSLKRHVKDGSGYTLIDNLGYTYANINKLASISDGNATVNSNPYAKASTYTYYSDGSVKTDAGRGVSTGDNMITYNSAKLVSKIKAGSTTYSYIYTTSGQKLSMTDGAKTYDYIGNAVYLNNTLEFVSNSEGRWLPKEQLKAYKADKSAITTPTAKFGKYEYQLKDHLGNLRASCRCLEKENATASNQAYPTVVIQENHYDPWGLAIEKEVVADKNKLPNFETKDRFTYNGKEMQGNLGYLDYGVRMYDPSIGRWGVIDPLAEKMPVWNPYCYVFNNPLKFIDPDGKEGIVVSGQPGKHDNKTHFLANGLDRAKRALNKRQSDEEKVTWLIYNDNSTKYGHDKKMLASYKEQAKKLGIDVQVVNNSEDITKYVNEKTGGDSRTNDKITSFYYVGHATPGDLEVGYQNSSSDYLEVSDFKSSAFASGAWINLVAGCRTAVDGDKFFEKSVVDQFIEKVDKKSTVNGSDVRVQYDGGVKTDQELLKANNGQIITKKGKL